MQLENSLQSQTGTQPLLYKSQVSVQRVTCGNFTYGIAAAEG
jgi:hypothetical protein